MARSLNSSARNCFCGTNRLPHKEKAGSRGFRRRSRQIAGSGISRWSDAWRLRPPSSAASVRVRHRELGRGFRFVEGVETGTRDIGHDASFQQALNPCIGEDGVVSRASHNPYNRFHVRRLRTKAYLSRLRPILYLRDGCWLGALLVRGYAAPALPSGNWRELLLPGLFEEEAGRETAQAGLRRRGSMRMASRLLQEKTARAASRQGNQR